MTGAVITDVGTNRTPKKQRKLLAWTMSGELLPGMSTDGVTELCGSSKEPLRLQTSLTRISAGAKATNGIGSPSNASL